jgi:hypothetical protein
VPRLGSFSTRLLTPVNWADLEALFGLPGGSIVRGCWCMAYRGTGKPPGLGGRRPRDGSAWGHVRNT